MVRTQKTVYFEEEALEYIKELMERNTRSFSSVVDVIVKDFKENNPLISLL